MDSFWLRLINEKLSDRYLNPPVSGLSKSELTHTGEILQFLVNRNSSHNLKLVTWSKDNNSNKYLLTMDTDKDVTGFNIDKAKNVSTSKKYKISYLVKE